MVDATRCPTRVWRHAAWRHHLIALVLLGWMTALAAHASEEARPEAERGFTVTGEVALASLMSIGDSHLQKLADSMHILAASDAARSADWERIERPLAALAERNIAALNWFALPDGSYWSVQNGREEGNLARRAYYPEVLLGRTVIGDLVVSTATGQPVAIVAAPVTGTDDSVVGVLGASVYLDQLSKRIHDEMALDGTMIFYSFDADALVALNWDPHLIFFEPRKSGDEDLVRAFDDMLSKERGMVTYRFRGHERTVAFHRSGVSGWWYAFGVVAESRGEAREAK
jgi:hypothetical protein